MYTIPLTAKVISVVNAIKANEIEPIVDLGEYLCYLDIQNVEMGSIFYTVFNKGTGVPAATFEVKYGSHHTIQQLIYNPLPRTKLPPMILVLPGYTPPPQPDPWIIPHQY